GRPGRPAPHAIPAVPRAGSRPQDPGGPHAPAGLTAGGTPPPGSRTRPQPRKDTHDAQPPLRTAARPPPPRLLLPRQPRPHPPPLPKSPPRARSPCSERGPAARGGPYPQEERAPPPDLNPWRGLANQPRLDTPLDAALIESYRQMLRDGLKPPPLVLWRPGRG